MAHPTDSRSTYRARAVRWGYIWALWSAVLWGAWYVPGTAVWHEKPFAHLPNDQTQTLLLAAAVITALNAIAVLLFLFIWLIVLGKFADYFRTMVRTRISKWLFAAAIFGGPMAIFGSYLAIRYVGSIFSAVAGLLFPIVGAALARLWYREQITPRAAIGILIIVTGGLSIYAPGLLGELHGNAGHSSWLGYLGGAMAAFGWGTEGAVAGRVLDVTDPDCGMTIRFTAETLYWTLLILPGFWLFTNEPVGSFLLSSMNVQTIKWVLVGGMSFAYCYVSSWKSFPLIGVGRGQAVANLYGVFAVAFISVFTLTLPRWYFLLGLGLVVAGGTLMYTENSNRLDTVRAAPATSPRQT